MRDPSMRALELYACSGLSAALCLAYAHVSAVKLRNFRMAHAMASNEWATAAKWDGPQIQTIRELVGEGEKCETINQRDMETGRTCLHNAAAFGADPEIVAFLCIKGADPTAKDCEGRVPLHFVVQNPSGAAARYAISLLSAGANPHAKDAKGNTPLSEARKKKKAAVIMALETWQPPAPAAEVLDGVRKAAWYAPWSKAIFAAIDKAFDEECVTLELVGVADEPSDMETSHLEMHALREDLKEAYKNGSMGGGSYTQVGGRTFVGRLASNCGLGVSAARRALWLPAWRRVM